MYTRDQILNHIISEDQNLELPEGMSTQEDYQEFAKIWELCDDVFASERKSMNTSDAWSQLTEVLNESPEKQGARPLGVDTGAAKVVSFSWYRLSLAVAFALTIGAALYLLRPQDPYQTDIAQQELEVVLPDQSIAELTPGSTLRYLKGEKFQEGCDRIVYLEGEAVFDIVHDPNCPFKVVTSGTTVDVLGTVFRYKAEGEYSESENIEGKVEFSVNETKEAQVLNPGDKISYDGESLKYEPLEVPPPPIPRNNVSVPDIIDILGDRFPIKLEMSNLMDSNLEVAEVDLRGDLNDILNDLTGNPDVQIDFLHDQKSDDFLLYRLIASPKGLKIDYSFEDHYLGLPLND